MIMSQSLHESSAHSAEYSEAPQDVPVKGPDAIAMYSLAVHFANLY